MRVHLLGLPHTETTREYSWCAYTQKIRKLADMLTACGHEVILYAGEKNEAAVAEHVVVVTRADQAAWFGERDWTRDVFDDFDPALPWWQALNARMAEEMRARFQPRDVIGVTMGYAQKPAVDAMTGVEALVVEMGIGYSGVWAPYRVFESWAWRHHVAALTNGTAPNSRPFDATIPNSFEADEFPLGDGGGGYYLFIGRFTERKGPVIAARVTEMIGERLVMAGQGLLRWGEMAARGSMTHRYEGAGFAVEGRDVNHVGVVGPVERAKLMGGATAVFVPTTYLEPFGGVAVEAMMCGTPVITSNWGAFTETVQEGVTGFRCDVLAEYIEAARRAPMLDRSGIRDYAVSRYSTEVVRHQYDSYLRRLDTLWTTGWET